MAKRDRKRTPVQTPRRILSRPSDLDRVFWLSLCAFAAATLLAYQPVWHGGFLWDDDGHVTKAGLRTLGGLWRIWFEPGATQQFYPVVHSAFWLQWHAWGLNSTGYHIVNILLHATSAALLVAILRRLRVPGAVLAGAIFALHPVQVESVAWITELKNTLSGVFYFAAALVYLRFDEERRPSSYWIASALFVLALLSKSVTATLPAALLVVAWWQRGKIEWLRDVRPLAPWLAVGVGAGMMTAWMERTFIGAVGSAYDFTFVERGLIAGRAVVFYLLTLVWPANLAFNYPRWTVSQSMAWQYLFPAAVAMLLVALWWMRNRSRAPLAALLFFGITLGPALGFVNVYPFAFSFVADHFQYLASAGIFALAAAAIATAVRKWGRTVPRAEVLALLIVTAPLTYLTWRDSHGYLNNVVLYRTTLARNPDSWLAHSNLAAVLLEQDTPDAVQALEHARAAVGLSPNQPATHFNLGLALDASGDPANAVVAYRQAIAVASPAEQRTVRLAQVHDRLAAALRAAGRTEDAAAEAAVAKQILAEVAATTGATPVLTEDDAVAAALKLLTEGKPAEAAAELSKVLARSPNRVDARFGLGLAYERLSRFDPALNEFRRVVAADPKHVAALQHLGSALHSVGRREEAIAAYQNALAIDPSSADTHNDLGVALAEVGRLRDAEPHFAEALRLNPADTEAKNNLEKTRQLLRRGRGGGLAF